MEWNFELLFAFQNEILLAWIILDESPPRLVATCSWGPQACNFGFLTGPPTTPPWTRSLPYFIPGKVTHSGGRKHRPINVPWEKFRKHDIAYIAYVFTRGCRHKDNKGLTFHLDRSTPPPFVRNLSPPMARVAARAPGETHRCRSINRMFNSNRFIYHTLTTS